MSDYPTPDAPSLTIPVPRGPLPSAPDRGAGPPVTLTIDGEAVTVPEGATLLDACGKRGV